MTLNGRIVSLALKTFFLYGYTVAIVIMMQLDWLIYHKAWVAGNLDNFSLNCIRKWFDISISGALKSFVNGLM